MDQHEVPLVKEKMIKENEIKKKMAKEDRPINKRNYYLMSSTGKPIEEDASSRFNKVEWKENPRLSLLAKIFSRNKHFTVEEVELIASSEPGMRKEYFDFFEKVIAYYWPPYAQELTKLRQRVEEKMNCKKKPSRR